jgi:hypothetical protein
MKYSNTIFVIGNGESRKIISLPNLKNHGQVYGCNAIYRDFSPDALFSVDRGITEEINNANYQGIHYTRKKSPRSVVIPEKYNGYSSGTSALALASYCATCIFMVGFDFGESKDTLNNIYAGTNNYRKIDSKPTMSKNWRNQIKKIIVEHPLIIYTRVVDSSLSATFEINYPNYNTITVLEFKQLFSC